MINTNNFFIMLLFCNNEFLISTTLRDMSIFILPVFAHRNAKHFMSIISKERGKDTNIFPIAQEIRRYFSSIKYLSASLMYLIFIPSWRSWSLSLSRMAVALYLGIIFSKTSFGIVTKSCAKHS